MKLKNLISILVITLFIYNCSSDSTEDLKEDEVSEEMEEEIEAITYDGQIKGIISSNCTSCHGSTPTNGAPFSLVTFSQVKGRVDRIIARTNSSSNPMPPSGRMSSGLRETIQKWKDEGLLEN